MARLKFDRTIHIGFKGSYTSKEQLTVPKDELWKVTIFSPMSSTGDKVKDIIDVGDFYRDSGIPLRDKSLLLDGGCSLSHYHDTLVVGIAFKVIS